MTAYIAVLRKDAGSDYGVDFPDFPGCITAGRNLGEARRMAAEALALHVQGMMEGGEALPPPSSLSDIMNDPANRDAVGFPVGLPAELVKSPETGEAGNPLPHPSSVRATSGFG